MRTIRHAVAAVVIGALQAALPAHAFNTKAGYDKAGAPGPVTPERIKSEVEEKAQKLQESWPRNFTFYGMPSREPKEFAALAKYMVYLFAVWTQKADSWRFAVGKAVEFYEYYDTAQVAAAVA